MAANSRLTIAVHAAGAGWSLARAPVGRGIRPALGVVYGGVERVVRREFGRTSIADVLHETLRL